MNYKKVIKGMLRQYRINKQLSNYFFLLNFFRKNIFRKNNFK